MAENIGGIFYTVSADTQPLIDQTRVVDRETARMAGSFNKVALAVKLLAAAMALVKAAQMADEMRLLGARVEVAAGSVEKAAAAMRELQSISIRTQTAVAANVQVFTRLNQSLIQMGGNQADTLRLTELLGMAIKVSGASATESASAMLQFGQALGSGKLAGDELRSLLENAPYLMRQLAAGIGVPVGALKKLGEEGKLTADVVVNALQKAAGQIEGDFAKMPQTLGAAFTTAVDALQRLIEKSDDASGTSAALTGIVKGTADVFDTLAARIGGASTESDNLGRNDAVTRWAENATIVLSYVADAADFVTRAFRQAGLGLGGLAASAAAAARGEFGQALDIIRQIGTDIMAISEPQYAGVGIRQRLAAMGGGTDGSDPMDRRARAPGPASKLKAPRDAAAEKKAADAAKKAAEKRAKDYADSLEEQKKVEDEARELGAKFIMEEQRKKEKAAEELAKGQTFAQDVRAAGDPVAQLELELRRKTELLNQYADLDAENADLYAQAKIALEQQTAVRIGEIVQAAEDKKRAAQKDTLQGYAELFGGIADVQKAFAGKQDGIYRALFTASKAFAIAEAIVKIQAGIANAAALPFPANLGAMATVATSTAGILTTIRGTNYGGGRQYGGPTSAGSLYRVNETGRPEMFTAANGSQYMLPTQSGRVTAADKAGSSLQVNVYQTLSVGQGVGRAEVYAAMTQAKDSAKAEILQTLYRTGRGPYQ